MTGKLKLLCKKIKSRLADGEVLEDIIASYSYLTEQDIEIINREVTS